MNVCDWPTWFVASGAIVIFAFTQRLRRRRRSCAPDAVRVPRSARRRRRTTVVCAETIVTPVVAEVSVIVQLPVPPTVVHGFAEVKPPGPESIVKLICVPSGRVREAGAGAVVHVDVRRERVRRRRCGSSPSAA